MSGIQLRKNFKSPPDTFKYGQKPDTLQFDRPKLNKDIQMKANKNNSLNKHERKCSTPTKFRNKEDFRRISIGTFEILGKFCTDEKQKAPSLNKGENQSFKQFKPLVTDKKYNRQEIKYTSPNRTYKSKSQFPLIKNQVSTTKLTFAIKPPNNDISTAIKSKTQNPQRQTSGEKKQLFFKKEKCCNSPTFVTKISIAKKLNLQSSIKLHLFEHKMESPKPRFPRPPTLADFQIGKRLGKGYFGQVFIVKHKEINFVCAMKVISRELVKRQQIEDQLIRQLKICSYARHANIVQFYGCFSNEQNIYILQQLMTDDQMYSILKKVRRFSQTQAAYLIVQILSALDYLHNNYITHRDIKPENILMTQGVAKLCDFGWAVYDPQDHRTSKIGTLLYLSPENVKGDGYDRRNDIWGIGILTYEMLIGNVPFNIWNEDEKHKIVDTQVKFPLYMEISQTAKDFILGMLEKDPDRRLTISQLENHPFLAKVNLKQFVDFS